MTKEILRPAAYYYPTTVLLVDDDPQYLMGLENVVSKDAAIYKSFNNPMKAYEHVKTYFIPQHLPQSCMEKEIGITHHTEVRVNINPIMHEVFNSKRFEHISAIVADHDMPEMKGLELLKKLKDVPIRKILLTGKATQQETLDAYNDGTIDQYISKDQDDFQNYLRDTIAKQCQEQFKNDTRIIIEFLNHKHENKIKNRFYLDSYEFMELLNDIVKKNNITEYYLINSNGSYILFDIDGNSSWFIVTDLIAAKGDEDLIPFEIILKLKDHPTKKFTFEDQDYYYAYIDKNDSLNSVDKNKITSFYQYQKNLSF